MIQLEPESRLTIDEVLESDWFKQHVPGYQSQMPHQRTIEQNPDNLPQPTRKAPEQQLVIEEVPSAHQTGDDKEKLNKSDAVADKSPVKRLVIRDIVKADGTHYRTTNAITKDNICTIQIEASINISL